MAEKNMAARGKIIILLLFVCVTPRPEKEVTKNMNKYNKKGLQSKLAVPVLKKRRYALALALISWNKRFGAEGSAQ